ncbi:hypothetical protein ACOMHN_038537 [Nucella lapillus]
MDLQEQAKASSRETRIVVRQETSTVAVFGGEGSSIVQFREQLEDYWKGNEIGQDEDKLKSLKKHVCKEVREALDCYPDNKTQTVGQVFEILRHIYGNARSTSVLLGAFTRTRQRQHEPVREYSSRVNKAYRELVRHQQSHGQEPLGDSVLRDHFVENLQDTTLSRHLQDKVHSSLEVLFYQVMEAAVRWAESGSGPQDASSQPMEATSAAAAVVPVLDRLVSELSDLKIEVTKLKRRLDAGSRDQQGGRRTPNEFTEDGRPICRKCQEIGHIARKCSLN